jgi:hypothetical protein
MDLYPQSPNIRLLRATLAFLVLPVICLGIKRAREISEEVVAAVKIRKAVQNRKPNVKRNRVGLEEELRSLDEPTFTRMFRMNKNIFFQLHEKCQTRIKRQSQRGDKMARLSSGSPVTTLILLAATIRWLAGGSLWDISFMFKMSHKTIHFYKYKVIDSINHATRGNITFPRSEAGLAALAKGFAGIGKGMGRAIPGVVAAVDSVCVQRKAPCARRDENGVFSTSIGQAFNRKGYFATTMLAFVDSNLRFLSISMSCYASSHDSTLFSASSFGKIVAEGGLDPKWLIVGDDAFVCRGNIITPYVKHSLSPAQRNYNYFLSLNRQVVERAFGLWKWKWGIFWRTLDIAEKNIKSVMEVTARLHNLCIDCKMSENLDDFICHNDIFWERTSTSQKKAGFLLPALEEHQLVPQYADAATIAAHTGIGDVASERSTRQRICQHIVQLGISAPDATSTLKRIDRVCGINRAQQIPFSTRSIGNVGI